MISNDNTELAHALTEATKDAERINRAVSFRSRGGRETSMRRVLIILLATLPLGFAGAQSIDIGSLDLSGAVIHQSGPQSFYIRSVGIDGQLFSLSYSSDEAGGWQLTSVTSESDNLLPASAILDFATVSAVSDEIIEVDGLLIDGSVYRGRLRVTGESGLGLSGDIVAGSVEAINQARAQGLAAILAADDEDLPQTVDQQLAELRATIAALREQNSELEDGLAALRAERNELARDIINVAAENATIRDDKQTLQEQLSSLQSENQRMQAEVVDLNDEVSRLTELVRAYRDSLESGGGVDSSAGTGSAGSESAADAASFPSDYVRSEDLSSVAAAFGEELDAIAAQLSGELQTIAARLGEIGRLSDDVAALERQLRSGIGSGLPSPPRAGNGVPGTLQPRSADSGIAQPSVGEADLEALAAEHAEDTAALMTQIEALQIANRELAEEKRRLETRILDDILNNSLIDIMADRLDRVVVEGFRESIPAIGVWRFAPSSAFQIDEDAKFAKLTIPAPQRDAPTLYRFQVRSEDDGWVGAGIHLYVDDVYRSDLYALGRSLLVWFTRDPQARRNNRTYLQLYRSDDDINMQRVMDAMIEESIETMIDVEVLYEPVRGYLTVAVNGEDKVRYRTWFEIDAGVQIALRSLGRAEFRNLTVTTATTE